jgi:hypothetical protein
VPRVEISRRVTDCLNFIRLHYEKELNWKVGDSYPAPLYITWTDQNGYHASTAFALEDAARWTDQQIIRQTLAVMGRLNELEEKEHKMINRTSAQEAEAQGKEVADALVPFLRTDVPPGSALVLGMVVSKWCGLERDASFMMGFAKVFEEYRIANQKQIEEPKSGRRKNETQVLAED